MKKNKHDHKGTKALKLTLFFTLMLAPILAIAYKCGYAMFNKNAYQSYSQQNINATQQVTTTSMFIENADYIAIYTQDETTTTYGAWITYNTINLNWTDYGFQDYNYNSFRLFNNGLIQLKDTNNTQYQQANIWGNTLKQISFNLKTTNTESWQNGYVKYYLVTYEKTKLDNAFYYAVDEMQNSDLFNWTTNTLMYSPIHAMTNGMGITTPAIAILVCYWLYLTAIYIVIDIVVETFTCITHMITNKLAE